MAILELIEITKGFGGLVAVDHVSLEVKEGEILGLIGPNGAGKSTLFNVINNVYKANSGRLIFDGQDITKLGIKERARRGIGRTFQLTNLAPSLTAIENVEVILEVAKKSGLTKDNEKDSSELVEFVNLGDKKNEIVRELTFFQKKMVEIARALALNPKLILLDEPLAGLNPAEIPGAVEIIRKINAQGISIFWIEHVMKALMGNADRVVALNYGKKIAEGTPKEIQANKEVIKSYLGEEF